jgi:(2Fe-2S) ferredoxin
MPPSFRRVSGWSCLPPFGVLDIARIATQCCARIWRKLEANLKNVIEFFVCTSGRVCPGRGGCDVAKALKDAATELGLQESVVVREEGCLSLCRTGPTVFVMPGWHQYGRVTAADCKELVSSHVILNQPVVRLLINGKSRPQLGCESSCGSCSSTCSGTRT